MSSNTATTTTTTAVAATSTTTAVEITTTPTTIATAKPPSSPTWHNKIRDSRGRFVASTAATQEILASRNPKKSTGMKSKT